MDAIRVDGKEVTTASSHLNAVLKYMRSNSLGDDAMDALILSGRVEFGSVFMDFADGVSALDFHTDDTRTSVYQDIDKVREFAKR